MAVPIVGETIYPHIIVSMKPGIDPSTFDVQVDTRHFPDGLPLAIQCLLQAVVFLMPQVFDAVAALVTQEILRQQRAQSNGGN